MSASEKIVFVPPTYSIADANAFAASLRQDSRGFARLSALLQKVSGIHLPSTEKNLSLMAGRLATLVRERGCANYDQYADRLVGGAVDVMQEFVSALTTNTTEFFREAVHFEYLAKIIPEIYRRRGELRVWCAASSTGQEVWTILMTLREALPMPGPLNLKLLATDIDLKVLERAAVGCYAEEELRGVPAELRRKYFAKRAAPDNAPRGTGARIWGVVPSLATYATFAPFNLTLARYPFQHPFDIVFCRNVLIYFERQTVTHVLDRLVESLRPDGHLFLGHSESGTLRSSAASTVAPAVYRRRS